MSKFFLVFKIQLLAVANSGRNMRKNRKQKATTLTGYVLMWLLMMALAAVYEFIYGAAFAAGGVMDAFPALIVFVASLLTLLSSISYTKSLIFCSKDYDMLFALPIRGSVVVAAKIATLYVLDLIVTMAILLPCGVIYGYFAAPSLMFYVRYYTLALFVPMVPILVAAAISALVSLAASRFRHAKVVGTIFSVALFFVFMLGLMSVTESSEEEIATQFSGIAETLTALYPPLRWFMDGVLGDFLMYLLFAGVSALAFAVIVFLFGRFYGKIHGIFSARAHRARYKLSAATGGTTTALVKKDIRRLLSSPGLMLNQLSGLIMLVVFMIIFLAGGDAFGAETAEQGEQIADIFGVLFPYLFAMCASMASLTCASISLEGKNFWLLRSLPVSARTVLSAKLRVHEVICFPVIVVCGAVTAVLTKASIVDTALLVLLPLLYSYNAGALGLLLNLKRYNFDWTNEVMVAKNSMPVMVVMFSGMLTSLFPGILVMVLYMMADVSTAISGGIMTLLALAVSVGLTVLLRKKGERMFEQIEA